MIRARPTRRHCDGQFYPIQILDGQHEIVTVTIAYEESGGFGGGGVPPPITATGGPHIAARRAHPLPGPGLGGSAEGTDLAITHSITPLGCRSRNVVLVTQISVP